MVFLIPRNISKSAPSPLPQKQLVDFIRTPTLHPGTSHEENVQLPLEAFGTSDWSGRTVAYEGTYTIVFSNGDGANCSFNISLASDTLLDKVPMPT